MLASLRSFLSYGVGVALILTGLRDLSQGEIQQGCMLLVFAGIAIWWGRRLQTNPETGDLVRANEYIAGGTGEDYSLQWVLFKEYAWNTLLLIALNTVPFYLINMTYGHQSELSRELAIAWGANYAPLVANGDIWRLLSSTFLHLDVTHYLGNMIALLTVGRYVDYYFGGKQLYFIYFVSGLVASLASIVIHPAICSLGASGAIFGLYGAFLVTFVVDHPDREKLHFSRYALFYMALHIFKSFAAGFREIGVDNAAHVGGLVTGAVLAFAILQYRIEMAQLGNYAMGALTAVFLFMNLTIFRHFPSRADLQAREIRRQEWVKLADQGRKYTETMKKIEQMFVSVHDHKMSIEQANSQWEARLKPELESLRTAVYYLKVTDRKAYQTQLDLYKAVTTTKSYVGALVSPDKAAAQRAVASNQASEGVNAFQRAVESIKAELESI